MKKCTKILKQGMISIGMLLVIFSNAIAEEPMGETLPFIQSAGGTTKIVNVPVDQIKTLIDKTKRNVCVSVGSADVLIKLVLDSGGKLGIATGNDTSGIEVSFDCGRPLGGKNMTPQAGGGYQGGGQQRGQNSQEAQERQRREQDRRMQRSREYDGGGF